MSLPQINPSSSRNSSGGDDYNSRSQQSHRLELVTASGSRSTDLEDDLSGGETASFVIPSLNPGTFESPSANQSTTDLYSPIVKTSASSQPTKPRPVQRSLTHREAVEALNRDPSGAATAAQAVQQLVDETMGQYQTILNESSSSSAATAGSAVPTSASSNPAAPTAPKRFFGHPSFATGNSSPSSSQNDLNSNAQQSSSNNTSSQQQQAPGAGMKTIRVLHANVQTTLGAIQNKTSKILQDQERDLLRSFKMRLLEVSDELEKERKKNESGSVEWVARCKKLTEELDWVRELTESLSTENKALLKENRKAARAAATQESDRQFLIKQLVNVKKENARLRYLVEQQLKENQEQMGALQLQFQHQQQQLQSQQQQQPQIAGLLHSGSSTTTSLPSPPLTSQSLAVHNNHPGSVTPSSLGIPKLRFQSITSNTSNSAYTSQPNTAPNRLVSSSQNPFPPPPANMRASLLAAATTEPGGGGSLSYRPQTGPSGDYLPPSTAGPSSGRGTTAPAGPGSARGALVSTPLLPETRLAPGAEKRFKSVIAKLKRQVETEASKARAMRTAYMNEVNAKTQLQHIFKQCVDAVREQLAQQPQHKSKAKKQGGVSLVPASGFQFTSQPPYDPRAYPTGDLSNKEKLELIEWFLSQDSVLLFIFDRMFPVGNQPTGYAAQLFQSQQVLYDANVNGQTGFHHFDQQIHPSHTVPMQFEYDKYITASGDGSGSMNSTGALLTPSSAASSPSSNYPQHAHPYSTALDHIGQESYEEAAGGGGGDLSSNPSSIGFQTASSRDLSRNGQLQQPSSSKSKLPPHAPIGSPSSSTARPSHRLIADEYKE